MRDADEMKMERDGQLGYGLPPQGLYALRGIFKFKEKLPNGHTVMSDGGDGDIEWRPKCCECAECQGRYVSRVVKR